jgi:hypothetical protein
VLEAVVAGVLVAVLLLEELLLLGAVWETLPVEDELLGVHSGIPTGGPPFCAQDTAPVPTPLVVLVLYHAHVVVCAYTALQNGFATYTRRSAVVLGTVTVVPFTETTPLVKVQVSPPPSTICVAAVGTIVPLAEAAALVEETPLAGVALALDDPLLVDEAVLDDPPLAAALEELSPVEDELLGVVAVVAVVAGAVAVAALVAVELLGEQSGTATAGAPF